MNPFKKIKAYLVYREAVTKANEAHQKTGERYYVMPTADKKKTLIVMDRRNFRKLKQKAYINRQANIRHLENHCFYCTPYKNGMGELHPIDIETKKEHYYQWYGQKAGRKKQTKH